MIKFLGQSINKVKNRNFQIRINGIFLFIDRLRNHESSRGSVYTHVATAYWIRKFVIYINKFSFTQHC